MHYFGGKAKVGKYIVEYLKSVRKEGQPYIEPFVGGGWTMALMDGERYGYDKHEYLIAMYKALQEGWIPPTSITKEEYYAIKEDDTQKHLKGFVGFGCSFSGKWFGGYANDSTGRNYCLNAHNSILRKMKTMKDVVFDVADYRDLNPSGALIYCDPPYQGTTQYGLVGSFDTEEFWAIMREWSKNNTVVISEYKAPEDFVEVWRRPTKTDMRNKHNQREDRLEKLFIHNSTYSKLYL